jgi:hypothetical protein
MRRDSIIIGGQNHFLAQGVDIDQTKQLALQAMRDGGGLVDLVVLGNRSVTALISPGVTIWFESIEVAPDDRDDGDLTTPFYPDHYDPEI